MVNLKRIENLDSGVKKINARTLTGIFFSIAALWFLSSAPASATLERSGRWMTYDGAHPYLVGYDLQQLFTKSSYTEAQVEAKIDILAAYGTTCFRVWLNTWFLGYGNYFPYTYSGGKFNLDSFSSAYWTRIKNLITYAKSKGIIVEVVVFSEYPRTGTGLSDYWTAFPVYWRTSENSNGVFSDVGGDLYPEFFTVNYTESGKNLTTYQLALAEKAIDELKSIGNVFFQVHNEFPAAWGTGQYVNEVHGWQEYMADYFHTTKGAITSVQAHEGSTMQLYGLDYWKSRPSVDILNFHPYSSSNNDNINTIGTMFGSLYTYGKVLMFDESHQFENATYTDTVTREMWAAFTNGIYYLAYQGDSFIIGDSGWISRAGRIQTLKNISDMGNWWDATRNPTLVTAGPGQYWQGIANSGNFYVYYFTGTKTTTAVSMNLPAGTYDYKWYDTRAWNDGGLSNGQVTGASPNSIAAPSTSGWDSATGVVLVIMQAENNPPSCSITSPSNGAAFTAPASITITANASDSDGTISKVEFSQGASKLGEDTSSPYSYAWNGVAAGIYSLTVKAYDNAGAVTTSAAIAISIAVNASIPGKIEAEDYKAGGEGVGYHDTTTGNAGSVYRSDGVDIEATGDTGGGYNIGWIADGEWLAYDVNVTASGAYDIKARVASPVTTGRLHIEIDGVDKTGAITAPNTGGYQTYTDVTVSGVSLTSGSHILKAVFDVAGLNINYINLTAAVADTTPPSAPGAVRDGAAAGTDISSTTSRTQLSANWTAATDAESGISAYQYAIGTTAGETNITNWTALGNVLTATKTGLSLTVGATYYFSVKAVNGQGLTGNAGNSNGQVVISTAVADTTPPSAPGTVRDGATAGTDDSFTYSTTALSANWTQSADSESGISGYNYAIGSSPGATNITNWTTLGNVLTITKTGLTLAIGTTYYFSVKAINGFSLIGSAANSDGQYVKVINSSDTTAPGAPPVVRDGLDITDAEYTYARTELSANWPAAADAESGISRYLYSIGSSPGATDITGWTGNGTETSVTKTGLSLVIGTTYYFSVKAENGITLQSTPANSDGVCIISGELPPVIQDVQSTNITANSVSISWTTDKQATSRVEYGITAVYGSQTTEGSSLVTAHSVVITGLTAGQAYHYRVISKDVNSNQAVSVDFTFTTLSTLNEVHSSRAYPNPCGFSNGKVIKFVIGAAGSETGEVRIYTLNGKLVRKLTAQSGATEMNWDGRNEDGQKVAKGVYVYKIINADGSTIMGKLAVTG